MCSLIYSRAFVEKQHMLQAAVDISTLQTSAAACLAVCQGCAFPLDFHVRARVIHVHNLGLKSQRHLCSILCEFPLCRSSAVTVCVCWKSAFRARASKHSPSVDAQCFLPHKAKAISRRLGNIVKRKSVTVAKKQFKLTLPYGTAAGTVGDLRHPTGALQYNQVQQDNLGIALRGMSYTTLLHQKSGHNTTHVHIYSHSKSHCRSHRSHMNLNNIPSTPHFTPLQVLKVTGDFCSNFFRWDTCSFYTPYHLSTTTTIPTSYSHLTFMNTHIESLHIFITLYTISESGAQSHSTSYQSHSHSIHTPFPHPLHDISSQSTHPSRYHSHHHST